MLWAGKTRYLRLQKPIPDPEKPDGIQSVMII